LEYSGEMQLLQKDFDMEKTYVDALWTHRIQENIPVINADPGYSISKNFQS